ncbi:MAG TPA: hypothetical protein VK890_08665 [Bacteroidia bacterium]|jgi:hypothetical protein|nr:hypothetical protein [Bacteroidia bacterium]
MNDISISQILNKGKTDIRTFMSLFLANNPAAAYTYLRTITPGLPFLYDKQKLYGNVRMMIDKGDVKGLENLVANTSFNPNANNITATTDFWSYMGVTTGNWLQAFQVYYMIPKPINTITK